MSSNIAFLFLTYGDLTHPALMKKYVSDHNIYIHPKNELRDPFFRRHVIRERIATKWGEISIVDATLALMRNAYSNKNNEWFILLSEDVYPTGNIHALQTFLSTNANQKSMFWPMSGYNESAQVWKVSQWWIMSRRDVAWFMHELTAQRRRQIMAHIQSKKEKKLLLAAYDESFFITALKLFVPMYDFAKTQCIYTSTLQNVVVKSPITWNRLTTQDYDDVISSRAFFIRKTTPAFEFRPHPSYMNLVVVYIGTESTQQYEYLLDRTDIDIVLFTSLDNMYTKIHPGILAKCRYICPILWNLYDESVRAYTEMTKPTHWQQITFLGEKFITNDLQMYEDKRNEKQEKQEKQEIRDSKGNRGIITRRSISNQKKIALLLYLESGSLHPVWQDYIREHNDKLSVYFYSQKKQQHPTNVIQIPIDRAYNESRPLPLMSAVKDLIYESMKDRENRAFIVLTGGCRPIRPFLDLYESVIHSGLSYADLFDVQKKDDVPPNYIKHRPYVCLTREHAKKLMDSREETSYMPEYFLTGIIGDESSTAVGNPNNEFPVVNFPLVHENWLENKKRAEEIDAEIHGLYVEIESDPLKDNRKIHAEIKRKKQEKQDVMRMPKRYTGIVSPTEVAYAQQSGAYFWRDFAASSQIPGNFAASSQIPASSQLPYHQDARRRSLTFIHITKTAGTSIEQLGYMHGVYWGRFDQTLRRLTYRLPNKGSEFWHVPTVFFNRDLLQELLKTSDLFAVIRDPVDRVISEYYCKWGGPKRKGNAKAVQNVGVDSTVASINQWIAERLEYEMSKIGNTSIGSKKSEFGKTSIGSKKSAFGKTSIGSFTHGHWVPQSMYLYNRDLEQIVKDENIVIFENLNPEMNSLLERYGYGFKMEEVGVLNRNEKKFSREDLTAENMRLIRELYAQDFEVYNRILSQRKSPSPIARPNPSPVKEKTPSPNPSPVKEKTPSPVKEKTPSPVKEKTPSPVKEKTPSPIKIKGKCPKGTRRNKKTGNCDPTGIVGKEKGKEKGKGKEKEEEEKVKRCPKGTRRNKKTGNCDPINK
jgi:hypothetical protein